MNNEQIRALSVRELTVKAKSGELAVIDIVNAYIEKIEQVNPAINAIVTTMFDEAREQARAADQLRASGADVPPLFGVPVTIKDCFDIAGVEATDGILRRKGRIAETDADAVKTLRDAGAIFLGKTNTPEGNWSQETDNLLYGLTKNPHNLEHTVGGSSGGEAAIIAAGGSPLGLGGDIAGSIRLPAAFTGIVGLRPTSGTLSEKGIYPTMGGSLEDLEAIGPFARNVEDVALAFSILTDNEYIKPDTNTLNGKKVAFWLGGGLRPANQHIRKAVHTAIKALADYGADVRNYGVPIRTRLAHVGWTSYIDDAGRQSMREAFAVDAFDELRNHLNGNPTLSQPVLEAHLGSDKLSPVLSKIFDGAHWRQQIRATFKQLVGEDGVVVCPIFPTTAPKHGWQARWQALFTTFPYMTWVNLAGYPGLTIPIGADDKGLPTAVQIIGAAGREDAILAAGLAIEQWLT